MDALHLAIFILIIILPPLLSWRGIGRRLIWFGGSLGSLLLFLLLRVHDAFRRSGPWRSGSGENIGFDPDWTGPWTREYEWALFFVAFIFLLAGLLFRPKKEASTSLLGNHEGRSSDARRANGKNQGD